MYWSSGNHDREISLISCHDFTLGAFSRTCPGKGLNEDRFFYWAPEPSSLILAVADGVGSTPQAHEASAKALKAFGTYISRGEIDEGAIMRGIDKANDAVMNIGKGSATTIAVALIKDEAFRYFSVGDSSALLIGGRGKIKSQSKGHSAYNHLVESGIQIKDQAKTEPLKYELVSYLGTKDYICEVSSVKEFKERDSVLVGSDGFMDNVDLNRLEPLSFKGRDYSEDDLISIENRLQKTMESDNGHLDDATAIFARRKAE